MLRNVAWGVLGCAIGAVVSWAVFAPESAKLPYESRFGVYCPGGHNWEAAAVSMSGNAYVMWSATGQFYGYAPITCEVARVK